MKDPSITWRRTFPDSAPGSDGGVAIFEGRVIGRVQHMTNLPSDPKLVVERHRPGARRADPRRYRRAFCSDRRRPISSTPRRSCASNQSRSKA